MNLLLFIIIGVGITNLVVNATIIDNLRTFVVNKSDFLGKLVTCMMCSGFWIGLLLSFDFGLSPLYGGAVISLSSQITGTFIDYLDLKIAQVGNEMFDGEDDI